MALITIDLLFRSVHLPSSEQDHSLALPEGGGYT